MPQKARQCHDISSNEAYQGEMSQGLPAREQACLPLSLSLCLYLSLSFSASLAAWIASRLAAYTYDVRTAPRPEGAGFPQDPEVVEPRVGARGGRGCEAGSWQADGEERRRET